MKENINYIGWLSPDGTHFKCDKYEHDDLSFRLLSDYYKTDLSKMKVFEREDYLFNMGWCRIGYQTFNDFGYVIQARWRHVTESQKAFIKDMYFDVGDRMTEQTINDLQDYDIIDAHQRKLKPSLY